MRGPRSPAASRVALIAATSAGAMVMMPVRFCRVSSTLANQNVRSFTIGPPKLKPYCSCVSGSFCTASGFRASSASLRKKPYARPRAWFVPDCVTMLIVPADARPNSATPPEVIT